MNIRLLILNCWLGGVFLIEILIFTVLFFPAIFLPARWRYRCRWHYWGTSIAIRTFLKASFLKFDIQGAEKLSALESKAAVVVLNHQACIDLVIPEMLLGSQPRIFFSNDYSKLPLIGTLLNRMHVIVHKASARTSQLALERAVALAKAHGSHIIIFPEGTRHSDGNIHKFYRGFTILAEQLHCPVVPIFLYGMHKVMPKRSRFLNPFKNTVVVRVGDFLFFRPDLETREEFLEKVHNWFTLECDKVNHNQ